MIKAYLCHTPSGAAHVTFQDEHGNPVLDPPAAYGGVQLMRAGLPPADAEFRYERGEYHSPRAGRFKEQFGWTEMTPAMVARLLEYATTDADRCLYVDDRRIALAALAALREALKGWLPEEPSVL